MTDKPVSLTPPPEGYAYIIQQAVGQLPWGHNLVLLTTLPTNDEP